MAIGQSSKEVWEYVQPELQGPSLANCTMPHSSLLKAHLKHDANHCVEVGNRRDSAPVQHKLLPIDRGNDQGVIKGELYS